MRRDPIAWTAGYDALVARMAELHNFPPAPGAGRVKGPRKRKLAPRRVFKKKSEQKEAA